MRNQKLVELDDVAIIIGCCEKNRVRKTTTITRRRRDRTNTATYAISFTWEKNKFIF